MKNYKLETSYGDSFDKVSAKAKQIATEKNVTVEFEFNGVQCLVNKNTNLEWLYRDYSNSWTMGWKTVGADCVEKYSKEVQSEFDRKTKIAEEKAEKSNAEYRAKEKKEKDSFEKK